MVSGGLLVGRRDFEQRLQGKKKKTPARKKGEESVYAGCEAGMRKNGAGRKSSKQKERIINIGGNRPRFKKRKRRRQEG